jgi:hypothetical protein
MGLEPTTLCMANRPGMATLSDNRCISAVRSSLSSGLIRLFGDKIWDKERCPVLETVGPHTKRAIAYGIIPLVGATIRRHQARETTFSGPSGQRVRLGASAELRERLRDDLAEEREVTVIFGVRSLDGDLG